MQSPAAELIGTLPQWGLFLTVVLGAIKVLPQLKKLGNEEAANLRADLAQQAKECAEENRKLYGEIHKLHDMYNGLRAQHMNEQLSLISLLAPNLSPEMQRALQMIYAVEKVEPLQRTTVEEAGDGGA